MARPVISSLINHFVNSRPQLFKRWIALFTGLITFERIRVRETKVYYPVDRDWIVLSSHGLNKCTQLCNSNLELVQRQMIKSPVRAVFYLSLQLSLQPVFLLHEPRNGRHQSLLLHKYQPTSLHPEKTRKTVTVYVQIGLKSE